MTVLLPPRSPPRAALAPRTGAALGPNAITVADAVSLSSYGFGLWWAFGGPTWSAIASIAADEIDGRVARAMNETSQRGSALDWGIDMALTPLALMRLGREIGRPVLPLLAAPPLMFVQAAYRAAGKRPAFGSVRAAVMIAAIVLSRAKK